MAAQRWAIKIETGGRPGLEALLTRTKQASKMSVSKNNNQPRLTLHYVSYAENPAPIKQMFKRNKTGTAATCVELPNGGYDVRMWEALSDATEYLKGIENSGVTEVLVFSRNSTEYVRMTERS